MKNVYELLCIESKIKLIKCKVLKAASQTDENDHNEVKKRGRVLQVEHDKSLY